ncbi:MAG: TonB family protein [Cellvibrio sp.]|uniref:TonB family protein n=1 Tax=Cellvibrio sp. TaxID=1965322 RepID=UPI0031A3B7BC
MKCWASCIGLLLVMLSGGLRAESGLNGVAVYSELGNDVFLGALYSGQIGTNAQELINGSYPKRIELKVISPQGITQRQFSRIWRESVAINSARDLLTAQVNNLIYFDGLIRDRLEPGDHLVIGFIPGRGVTISLNSVQLGHVKSDAFFGMLLQSWIGIVPPSTKFRDDLLNLNEASNAQVSRFITMYPRTARVEVVKSWLQPEEKETVVAKLVEAPKVAAVAPQPKASVETTAVAVKKPIVTPVQTIAVAAPAIVEASQPEIKSGLSEAEALLARQFYISDVFKKIYAQVNYPRRAQELQQMGTVKLVLVIDSVGNVKAVESVDESKFTLLNKAALAAVRSAAPFPPLPRGLNLAELELFVPITFSMGKS